jgi:hypothetical protein
MKNQENAFMSEHIGQLATELARETGITDEQAYKVLEALRVDKLIENMNSTREVLQDESLAKAIGYRDEHAQKALEALSPNRFTLKHVGLAFVAPNVLHVAVAV